VELVFRWIKIGLVFLAFSGSKRNWRKREFRIIRFKGRKTGLFIPYWMAGPKVDRPILGRRENPSFDPLLLLPERVVDFHKGIRDLLIPHVSEKAQNGNRDSIRAYLVFSTVPVTGLIGALLNTYFQIMGIRTQNSEQSSLRGEKPAFLFPIGWQIPRLIGQYSGKGKTPLSILCSYLPESVVDFHKGSRDLILPHVPKWAQNDDQDSIQA